MSSEQPQTENQPELELEHAIGYSGTLSDTLFLHPQIKNKILYPTGSAIFMTDLNDPHDQKIFSGHDENLSCVAFTKSGNIIAAGQNGHNSDVIVWDVFQNKLVYRFSEHDIGIRALAFSNDERVLCSIGNEKTEKIIFYDLYTGNIINQSNPTCQPVNNVIFGGKVKDIKNKDTNNYLLVTSGNRSLEIWSLDPLNGNIIHNKMNLNGLVRDYTILEFSNDFKYLYAGSKTGDILVINIKHCSLYSTLCNIKSGISLIKSVSNGLLIGGDFGEFFFYELVPETRAEQASFHERCTTYNIKGKITGIGIEENNQLVIGTANGYLYRAEYPAIGKEIIKNQFFYENHCDLVKSISYDRSASDRFATCSYDKSIRIWDLNNYKTISSVYLTENGNPLSVSYTLDCIFTGWEKGFITSHNSDNGEFLWALKNCHTDGCTQVKVSNNQRFLISGGRLGEIRLWQLKTREMICNLKEHVMEITGIELFSDDLHVISSSRDRNILCWDLKAERRIASLLQKMGYINKISLASDQTTIISVSSDRCINYWDLRTPNPVNSIPLEEEPYCVDANKSNLFAVGGTGAIVSLYDMRSSRPISVGHGHSNPIFDLEFSPDDKQLSSVGGDGIFVWNIL